MPRDLQKPFSRLNSTTLADLREKWSLMNLHMAPLKVSARVFPPYVMYKRKTIFGRGIYSGAEINMVKLITAMLNMSFEIERNEDINRPIKNK